MKSNKTDWTQNAETREVSGDCFNPPVIILSSLLFGGFSAFCLYISCWEKGGFTNDDAGVA
jgi:hypothetical protein